MNLRGFSKRPFNNSSWSDFQTIGEEQRLNRQKVSRTTYLAILVFFTLFSIFAAYALLIFGFGKYQAFGGRWFLGPPYDPFHFRMNRPVSKGEVDFYIALPGLIGGLIGFIIGLAICVKLYRNDKRDAEQPNEAN